LRERREDIPLFAHYFLGRTTGPEGTVEPPTLSDEAGEALLHYDWPGNVRELENALERAAVVADNSEIRPEHLPGRVVEAPTPSHVGARPHPNPSMEVIERAYIEWVLRAEGGNKSRAAEVLGIDPSTLYRKLNRYGLTE
jgi:two-component system response regulator HydG